VLPEAAIKVFPLKLAQGKLPEHYRKGWEEKEKHGGSLIGDQVQMPTRRPDELKPEAKPGLNSGWKP
jgi:ferredoxin-type protein NapG